nr:MAG TPA: hypothetical protein [Caudoviricetes sp.]
MYFFESSRYLLLVFYLKPLVGNTLIGNKVY